MNRHFAKGRFYCAALVALLAATSASAQELVATITKLERRVDVQIGTGAWQPAKARMTLSAGDKIHTGFRATATVRFADGSTIDVKPMTMVMLQKLEDADGKVKNRVFLKLGEVAAEVRRPAGTTADFQVKTATTTASVRGTSIRQIATHPGIGTVVRMGARGLVEIAGRTGRAHAPRGSRVAHSSREAVPLSPGDVLLRDNSADIQPAGTLREEQEDIFETGVPKTNPLSNGGSGFASDLTRQLLEAGDRSAAADNTTRVSVPIPPLP